MLPDLDEKPRETTQWEKSQENISEKMLRMQPS
jgi:hypothetical protein